MEASPLMTRSSHTDLNINHCRNDEIQNNKTSEEGDFEASGSNCGWQIYAHDNCVNDVLRPALALKR